MKGRNHHRRYYLAFGAHWRQKFKDDTDNTLLITMMAGQIVTSDEDIAIAQEGWNPPR